MFVLTGEILRTGTAAVFVIGLCGVLLKWIRTWFEFVWLRPKSVEKCMRQQGFSGNSYRVLVGDLRDSSKMDREAQAKPLDLDSDIRPRVMPFIHHTVQKYGKKCFTWMGPYLSVIVMDPEMAQEILTKHESWPKPFDLLPGTRDLPTGLVELEGEGWKKQRTFINPAFHTERTKNMFGSFQISCKKMLKEWEKMASPTGSIELDSWSYCSALSNEMLARAIFGNINDKDGLEIFEIHAEYKKLTMQALQSVFIPGSKYLPTKYNMRLRRMKKEVHRMFKDKIEEKEKDIAEGTHVGNDLVSFMLASNSEIIREQGKEHGLTLDEMISQCEQFHDAGQSAVASLFVWTLVMLSHHQDWQDKARDEILEEFGHKDPDFDGLGRLKIVTMILNEVLRLYPPAYFTMRVTKQEMKLDQVSLPAGVLLTIPIMLLHHDPDLWGADAEEFNPERFADGVGAATKGRLSFLPFSTGPRICIGYRLVCILAKLLVATLLQRFNLNLSPAYTHAPFPLTTTLPQHGALLTIRTL